MTDLSNTLATPPANAFARLGGTFLTRLPAAPLDAPYLVGFSAETAARLGMPEGIERDPGFIELFCGNATRDWPVDTLPYASVYSGHQFGVWAGQLGDGRALGLGELEHDGERNELQLKGAGRTPYSRMSCFSPSIVQSALKILWRQCSLLACANIISSTSVGLRPSFVNASTR